MSAIYKINNSGLNVDERRRLKKLIAEKPNISKQIEEDDQLDDDLLRDYLDIPISKGKSINHLIKILFLR